VKNNQFKSCPSCGCSKLSEQTRKYNPTKTSLTIENVVHGAKQEGVVRIEIEGGRKRGGFQCEKCGIAFEFDCTDGVHLVNCPKCKTKECRATTPIASVIAGVKGVPTFVNQRLTKKEQKKYKFAKNCYKRSLELKFHMDCVIERLSANSFPATDVDELRNKFHNMLVELDEIHSLKIEAYGQ